MGFSLQKTKGLTRCFVDTDVDWQKFRLHISETVPGTSSHPPHTHEGAEAFYVLEGHATVEVEGEQYSLGPNEAILVDATKLHGIVNTGATSLRYLVIITKP